MYKPLGVFAVRDRSEEALLRAASGGAFCVLARPVIEAGGVVFGACDFGHRVAHVPAESLEELAALQGSVYAQSDMSDVYSAIEAALGRDKPVLFVGTPCQCAAIVSYLKTRRVIDMLETCENLFVCDLVCHGVPSAELYAAHRRWLARRCGASEDNLAFTFRSKDKGWGLYYKVVYECRGTTRSVCAPADENPYYSAFLRGSIYRDCCYVCPFAKEERVSDFTIGDYWGIETAHPEFYDMRGVSLMLANTPKARHFFVQRCTESCDWVESSFGAAVRENRNLERPTPKPDVREGLMGAIADYRVQGVLERVFDRELKPKLTLRRLVKRVLPARVLGALKRLMGKVG